MQHARPLLHVVGYCGAAGAGKDTAAGHWARCLGEWGIGWKRRALADALREDVVALGLAAPGEVAPGVQRGYRVRRLLQVWGTEHGRALDPDYWLLRWSRYVLDLLAVTPTTPLVVLVPDVRFPNEAAFILDELGGYLYMVEADERLAKSGMALRGPAARHPSEEGRAAIKRQFDHHPRFRAMGNNRSLDEYAAACREQALAWARSEGLVVGK